MISFTLRAKIAQGLNPPPNRRNDMMPIEDFIITVYCCVEDLMDEITEQINPLRKRGFSPKLTDVEVITMEIVGEFLGIDTDKGIWEYFGNHWLSWFPALGSRTTFARQAANLWAIKQRLHVMLAYQLSGYRDGLHIVDGFPMPVTHFKRAYGSQLFKGIANYGYCASKSETYYGFHGNIAISSQGVITGYTVTVANIDERDAVWDISAGTTGLYLGDKGYLGQAFQEELRQEKQINMQTPLRKNMTDKRSESCINLMKSVRRKVETVIGQLAERFHIEKVRARDLWHLTSRNARKILAHTMAIFINVMCGGKPLQFEGLIGN